MERRTSDIHVLHRTCRGVERRTGDIHVLVQHVSFSSCSCLPVSFTFKMPFKFSVSRMRMWLMCTVFVTVMQFMP